ncbi:Leucyl-trna synthetase [Lasiodiplodia theobromae]|uniref:Leucyl-trna synthetase n=1 Tax=Lasiodiplodia theobromae TaxID=45133 RepID=UPI0015C39EBB|nr:Leucyl-trna synthetase [Lasiodiplodia theobromae]KAF4536860.1 Leucyl-trna synthetase [Lasiodiplodia theobromae]
MHTIQPTKATAIVTAVPSDSPDDLALLSELFKKPGFYGVERQWLELSMLSVIRTPAYGDLAAPAFMESLKISSVHDRRELETARGLAYKEGYFHGVMNTGDFADIFGQTPGLAGIGPDQMTDDVWDYVLTRRDLDPDMLQQCNIPEEVLASMRREVEY